MQVVVVAAKLQTQEQAALVVAVLRLQVVLQAILVHLILVEVEVPLAALPQHLMLEALVGPAW
jgi:hypothetical protein